MPKVCDRPIVHDIAHYLQRCANCEVPRLELGKHFGIPAQRFPSILTAIAENYHQIGEGDDNALIWVEER
jgi:hypothetical protein